MPDSPAISEDDLVCSYKTPLFDRITITPKIISVLDEAVVLVFGELKWPAIKKLEEDSSIIDEPAQVLKRVKLLTIFSDYKNIE